MTPFAAAVHSEVDKFRLDLDRICDNALRDVEDECRIRRSAALGQLIGVGIGAFVAAALWAGGAR